jgi:hypothetical protein
MARRVDHENQRLWRSRLRRFKTSGLTVMEFCDVEEISVASFYQWRKRLAAERVDSGPSLPFVPVHVSPAAVSAVEIHLPNGARVCLPGGDAEVLRVAIESAGRAHSANFLTEAASC